MRAGRIQKPLRVSEEELEPPFTQSARLARREFTSRN
jgi:hypothetical protein